MSQHGTSEGKKVLVLGLGNTILTDDGVGIYVMREIQKTLQHRNLFFQEASLAGLRLLDILAGYDAVVIIDSIKVQGGQPGDIFELDPDSLRSTTRLTSVHDVNLATALELGKQMGIPMPRTVKIYAIQAEDTDTFGERCTPKVEAAIFRAAQLIADQIIPLVRSMQRNA